MNQETRVDWWHYTFTSTSWRMTENHSNVVAAAQFFKNYCKYYTQAWLVQMPPTSMCPEARGVPWASPVPWWHMTALAVLGARDLPQLCYVTRQLQLLHHMTSTLGFTPCQKAPWRGMKCFVSTADESFDVIAVMYDLMQCVHFPINYFFC